MAGSQPARQGQSGGASQCDEFHYFSGMSRARPWETDFAIGPCPNTGRNSRKCSTQSISATGVAGEPAFYGKVITPVSFSNSLSASGILNVPQGGGHILIGFFNADTVNEWRTPNTIALRIYGRGSYFLAYLEYGTGLWRAGGTSFGGEAPIPTGGADYPFSFTYDPNGAGGLGTVTATFGSYSSVMTLDSGHKADGAMFNRFGILNVMKSADDPGQIWLDNVTINGEAHPFNSDPGWDQRNNRRTYTSTNVRPRFDFGYSPGSNFAGGQSGDRKSTRLN